MDRLVCLPVCYWSWRLESNRWKAKSSSPAMYQRLSQAPRPTVISHMSELKLNWNSQVSEMYERPSATTSLTTYRPSLCFFALRYEYNILHGDEVCFTLDKSALLDASEQDEWQPSLINVQLCNYEYILFEFGGLSHFEMKATECDIHENEKNHISQNTGFTSLRRDLIWRLASADRSRSGLG